MKNITLELLKLREEDEQTKDIRLPRVTLSYAQTLDGSLTVQRGQPTSISNSQSQELTHELRTVHDAIIVGVGTVISDNPRLTVRLVEGENPLPIILDPHLRSPLESNLIINPIRKAVIFCSEGVDMHWREEYTRMGATVIPVPFKRTGELDLQRVLQELNSMFIKSVMVEGGGRVITGFLRERVVDYAVVTLSPKWLGGFPVLQGVLGQNMDELPGMDNPRVESLGNDLIIWGRVKWGT
ncbi:MAG: RibD family protein [Leptolinea sp.]